MAAPPLPKSPHESEAHYLEYLLRHASGTHGGLLCPQRFQYKDDDAYIAAVKEWSAARPKYNGFIDLVGVILVAVFVVIMLIIAVNL